MASGARSGQHVELKAWAEQLPDVGNAVRAEFGPEAAARFSQELFRFQRRRCFLYALVIALLVAPFFVYDLWYALDQAAASGRLPDITDPVIDGVLILFHAVFAAIFQRLVASRETLMRLFMGLLMAIGVGIVLYVRWSTSAVDVFATSNNLAWLEPVAVGGTTMLFAGAAHLFASFFVALSPREALIPVLPITVAYILSMLLLVPGPPMAKVWMIAVWPLAALPGLLWSTWRYRIFVESFRFNVLRTRLGDMRQDLADARRVHESLFPAAVTEGAVRCDYAYEPMREIGGDYLFLRRRANGSLVVVLADVVGHGVAAALAANRIHGELERLFEDRPDATVADAMLLLNRFVHRSLAPQAMYVSALAIACDEQELSVASAGHPPALFVRADGSTEEVIASATLLGVVEPGQFTVDLWRRCWQRGDVLITCTDGVFEAADEQNEFFGFERLRERAMDARVGGPDRIAPAVLEAVSRYREGEPADDVLVAVVWHAGA